MRWLVAAGDRSQHDEPVTQSTHDALALLAQQGDQTAMHELLVRLDQDGTIRTAVRRLVLDADAVQDISQEVFIAVSEKLHTWDADRRPVTTWVRAIARNRAIDHLRQARTDAPMPEELPSGSRRISSLITSRETVRTAVADLPDPYRQAVELRDLERLDYDEISRVLCLPASTVRTHVSRGRAMVAAALGPTATDFR